MNDTSINTEVERVECPAAKDPAVRLFILAGMFIGFGVWCIMDLHNFPKPDKPFPEDINAWASWAFNHGGAYVFTPLGVVPLIWGIIFLRRRLNADDVGIGYAGRKKISWNRIERLDSAKLKEKGILALYYNGGKKLTLDSWKLKNFKDLVTLVERHVPGKDKAEESRAESTDSA